MAVDMFLKLEGIKGESLDDKHKDEIEVLSWSWGATNSGTAGRPGGGSPSKVNIQDLSITKRYDKSSPQLFLRCARGQHIATATLSVRKAGRRDQDDYLKITMTDVMVSSYQTGVASGGDAPADSVSFNFAKVEIRYRPQTPDGSVAGPVTACWNIRDNTDCQSPAP